MSRLKLSYDYSDLIAELKEEQEDGILSVTDDIQILRSQEPLYWDYYPIIDWYYNDKTMKKEILSNRDERKEYEKDKPRLETITLGDCLSEMGKLNQIV